MTKTNRRDHVRFARVPYLADTEILEATYFSHVFGKHTHEEFAIGVVDAGSHVSEWGGATHRAGAGALIVNNPDNVHTGRPGDRDGWSYRMLYPPPTVLTDVATQLADRSERLPRVGAGWLSPRYGQATNQISNCLKADSVGRFQV